MLSRLKAGICASCQTLSFEGCKFEGPFVENNNSRNWSTCDTQGFLHAAVLFSAPGQQGQRPSLRFKNCLFTGFNVAVVAIGPCDVEFDSCTFKDTILDAIWSLNNSSVTISSCRILSVGRFGAVVVSDSQEMVVSSHNRSDPNSRRALKSTVSPLSPSDAACFF